MVGDCDEVTRPGLSYALETIHAFTHTDLADENSSDHRSSGMMIVTDFFNA
jgi:hypothetical protein